MFFFLYIFLLGGVITIQSTHLDLELERIWIIRHCDKPIPQSNPCCSDFGYNRAKNWHLYFEKYFTKKNIIELYSSSYNEKKVCLKHANHRVNTNKSCQKSQRMFLTANYIQENLKLKYNVFKKNNLNYCVGQKNKLLKNILKNDDILTDIILVWEHKEIVRIINEFGIHLTKWRNKYIDEYSIVFLIDVKTKQLYYDCFDFINNATNCSQEIKLWLTNFQKIDILYKKYKTSKSNDINLHNNICIIFMLFGLMFVFVLYLMYTILIAYHQARRRQGYIEIS